MFIGFFFRPHYLQNHELAKKAGQDTDDYSVESKYFTIIGEKSDKTMSGECVKMTMGERRLRYEQ